jgi:formamidopyrimidine-DNA glycosylase
MPEGPEVRKYADALDEVLSGRVILSLEARTKEARNWLEHSEQHVVGRRLERVVSHGKHLIGYISGGFFFHSHLMMWGRWQTFTEPSEKDRRERARIVAEGGVANCKLNPWLTVRELTNPNVNCLTRTIPQLAADAYKRGATASDSDRERMASDPALVYQPGREYGTRHLVFRRTNLPCLRCGETIRQLRQKTAHSDDEDAERTRIVDFCAQCQGVNISNHRS